MMSVKEHYCVILTADLPKAGTVVQVHSEGIAYEVEFMTLA